MPTPLKSDALHALTGTKSQAKEPGFVLPAGRPRYPKGISGEAKQKFKQLCGLLESRRALTTGDGELLAIYAITFDRWTRSLEKIREQGEICMYVRLDSNGNAREVEKPNLHLKVAETCEKNMVAILDRLGLTPHNRSKVQPTKGAEAEKPLDDFEQAMSRVRDAAFVQPPYEDDANGDSNTNFEA